MSAAERIALLKRKFPMRKKKQPVCVVEVGCVVGRSIELSPSYAKAHGWHQYADNLEMKNLLVCLSFQLTMMIFQNVGKILRHLFL